jgi:hypothetical protein
MKNHRLYLFSFHCFEQDGIVYWEMDRVLAWWSSDHTALVELTTWVKVTHTWPQQLCITATSSKQSPYYIKERWSDSGEKIHQYYSTPRERFPGEARERASPVDGRTDVTGPATIPICSFPKRGMSPSVEATQPKPPWIHACFTCTCGRAGWVKWKGTMLCCHGHGVLQGASRSPFAPVWCSGYC